MNKINYNFNDISLVLYLLLLLGTFGGFFDWAVAISGVVLSVETIIFYCKNKKIKKLPKDPKFYAPFIFGALALLSTIWAIDRSSQVQGLIFIYNMLLWYYLIYLNEEATRLRLLSILPILGGLMAIVGFASYLLPSLYEEIWIADRFGGSFIYPNTCALFFVICIVILTHRIQWKKFSLDYILLALNLAGLLITGSRSMELLFVLWAVYLIIRQPKLRKPGIIGLGGLVLLMLLFAIITGFSSTVSRIFTLFSNSSTIWGRVLYTTDGLKYLIKNPGGLGYLGSYYAQGLYQNGIYSVRYLHNDILQSGMDYGILAMLVFIAYFVFQLIKGNTDECRKEVLAVIFFASFADFHLQYFFILAVAFLCLDYGQNKEMVSRKKVWDSVIFVAVGAIACAYFAVPYIYHYKGDNDKALNWFGSYTDAEVDKLINEDVSREEAIVYSEQIISHNKFVPAAYSMMAYVYASEGNFDEAMENMDRVIELAKYSLGSYRAYDELLRDMIAAAEESGNMEMSAKLKSRLQQLPEDLAALKDTTSPLAFKIHDQPVFEY